MSDTSKINWKHNDIVTEHDFNRIEKSIDNAHRPAYITKTYQQKAFSMPEEAKSGFAKSIEIKGQTLFNSIVNGDFRSGTNNWSVLAATITATDNILSMSGTGYDTNSGVLLQNIKDNIRTDIWFLYARVRSLESDASYMRLYLRGSTQGATEAIRINNPAQNQWYELYGLAIEGSNLIGNLRFGLEQRFVSGIDTTNKILEVDGQSGVFAVNLTALGLASKTADEIKNMISDVYFEGLQGVQGITINSCGKNLFNIEGKINESFHPEYKTPPLNILNGSMLIASAGTTEFIGRGSFIRNLELNTQYVLSFESYGSRTPLVEIYDAKNLSSSTLQTNLLLQKVGEGSATFTTRSNSIFVSFTKIGKTTGDNVIYSNIQIEQGTKSSAYEVYKSLTPIKIAKVGYKLPNGVADSIYMREGKWYREQNVGVHGLLSGDVTDLITTGKNNDYVVITKPTDYIDYNGTHPSIDLSTGLESGMTSSSVYATGQYMPTNLVDGSLTFGASTAFASGYGETLPQWVQIDLGSVKTVHTLKWINNRTSTRFPGDYTVEVSETGLFAGEEIIVDSMIGNTSWDSWVEHKFTPIKARYVRMVVTKINGTSYFEFTEWRILGYDDNFKGTTSGNITLDDSGDCIYEDSTDIVGKVFRVSDTSIGYAVVKDKYASVAEAQADLTTKEMKLLYQINEPIITELDINPNFLISENILIETDTVVPEVKLEYCSNSAAVRERNTIVHDLNNKRYKENQIKTIMGVV